MKKLKIILSLFLAFTFSLNTSMANLVPIDQAFVKSTTSKTEQFKENILKEIEKPETQLKIEELGISPLEAKRRIAGISGEELYKLSQGNNQAGGAVIVVGLGTVLLVVILVLLLD